MCCSVVLFVVVVFFFYPVASQVSVQLVLMHSRPADLDHRAVDYLHGHVLRGSRGNCTGEKQASESWENNRKSFNEKSLTSGGTTKQRLAENKTAQTLTMLDGPKHPPA